MATTQSIVRLSAMAELYNGIGAQVFLTIDGKRVGEGQYVNVGRWSGKEPQDIEFKFSMPSDGIGKIGIEYANDEGSSRALYVMGLSINNVALSAQDLNFEAYGSTQSGTFNLWYNGSLVLSDPTKIGSIFGQAPSTGQVINGTDMAEVLTGGANADTVNGGGGNDTLIGGGGNDFLTGGSGADIFKFAKDKSQDTITDFNFAQGDRIDLTGTGITGLDKLQVSASSGNQVIGLGDGTTITVKGAAAPESAWFKFDPADGGTTPPTNPPSSTQSTVEMTAQAILANGIGALVYLVVNGQRVGAAQLVTSQAWSGQPAQKLTFVFDTPAKVTSLALEFANDLVDGGDRALLIQSLKVNGTALTANESVLVTPWGNTSGTWDVWYNAKVQYDMTGRGDIFQPIPGQVFSGTDAADLYTGAGGADTINGAGGDDTLRGGDGADVIKGDAGNDVLDGGLGADNLTGGAGNDRYVVDHINDVVTEALNAGDDTIEASVAWALGANVERLVLTGTADINGTGNSLNNTLTGNAGANLLSGGAGNDTLDGGSNAAGKIDILEGGLNDDTYIVRNTSDVVRENANEGNDSIYASVSYTIAGNVESLVLTGTEGLTGTGSAAGDRISGNDGANALKGLGGNDTVLGGAGNDTLEGGVGNDLLTGGAGSDTFRFIKGGGEDVVTDFNASQGDLIDLSGTGITGLDKLQISSSGSTYKIDLGSGTTITLNNSSAPQASWFKFDTGGGTTPPSGSGDSIFDIEGISLPSYWGGRYQQADYGLAAFDRVQATGANSVTIIPNFFQETPTSNEMQLNIHPEYPQWGSESDTFAQVTQAIQEAVGRGMKVTLKPHIEANNRTQIGDAAWRALFNPTDPVKWFENYKWFMVEYAKAAQAGGASNFVVGTEMKSMTDPTKVCADGQTYTQKWEDIINAVDAVFSGQIGYAATDEEAMKIGFWGAEKLDWIGVDAYFSQTNINDPTVDQLVDSWITNEHSHPYAQMIYGNKSVINTWKELSELHNKKVVFTEIGWGSYDGVNKSPGWIAGSTVDYQEQKDAYEAFFKVMKNYGGQWFGGAMLWSDTTSRPQDFDPNYYVTFGKPAHETVIREYSSPEHVTGLTWTGTAGADKLDGGYNNDTLSGFNGNDALWGGAGHDIMSGGMGADRFSFGSGSGNDTITDFNFNEAGEAIVIAKNVNGLNLTTFDQLLSRMSMVEGNTVIDLGNGNTIKLMYVNKSSLAADDFIFA